MGEANASPQALALVLTGLLVGAGCGGTPTRPDATPEAESWREHLTPRFVFHYTPAVAGAVASIAAAAEAVHARITADLEVASMPQVHVYYYDTAGALRAAVRPIVGDIPPWANGLVTGAARIHLVSPGVQGQTVEAASTSVIHEFAHCVELALEPRVANNPRWLWESVALYEARQFVDPVRIPYLAGTPPSLAELSSFDNTRVYDVGFLIGEFIVTRWGGAALPALVRALGDTRTVLGISAADFEREWIAFVRTRYGLSE